LLHDHARDGLCASPASALCAGGRLRSVQVPDATAAVPSGNLQTAPPPMLDAPALAAPRRVVGKLMDVPSPSAPSDPGVLQGILGLALGTSACLLLSTGISDVARASLCGARDADASRPHLLRGLAPRRSLCYLRLLAPCPAVG
jgi:hypothetical protein